MLNNGFPSAGSVEKKEIKSLDDKYQAVFISLRVLQILLVVFAVACILMPDMAFAAGGLAKTKKVVDTVAQWLQYLAIGIVTIAIFVVGYKVLFGGQTVRECAPILIGCAIIGGASEIASLLLG
jgi:trbC/VIRB2 family